MGDQPRGHLPEVQHQENTRKEGHSYPIIMFTGDRSPLVATNWYDHISVPSLGVVLVLLRAAGYGRQYRRAVEAQHPHQYQVTLPTTAVESLSMTEVCQSNVAAL